jgi:hypothetical protein
MSTLAWTPLVSNIQSKHICVSCLVPTDKQYGCVVNNLFVCDYCHERDLHKQSYCEHCGVIAIQRYDKYCTDCVNEIVDSLAVEYQESVAVEKGWM